MSAIFVILFLAAVVGIFKPFIKGSKRSHFAIAAVVSFFLVGITASSSTTGTTGKAAASGTDATASASNTDASSATTTSPNAATSSDTASKWEYSNDTDQMRGTSSKEASVMSDNTVDLQFPYGEVHGRLWVRKRERRLDAAFAVEKGQILCHSFSESVVSIKFDDGPIQKFRCTEASDGSDDVAFLLPASRFLTEVKRSKKAIVEAEFFQQGRQQFTFDTAGLNWK